MKRHGKRIALLLCISMILAFSTGCDTSGGSKIDKEIKSVDTGGTSESSAPTEAGALDDVLDTSDDVTVSDDKPAASDVTVEEQVLLDEKDVKITAKSLSEDWAGPELGILIENNSDKSLVVQVRNASVNGYMVETMISEEVAPGKKANSSITFMASELEECGITTFGEMEFSFHIFDDLWEAYIDSDPITVKTSAYGTFEQAIDDSGEVFYDQNGIKIIGKGLSSDDSVFGPGLIVYIENNSDKDFTVQVRDTSINGFMIDTSMSEDVLVGKKAISAVTFFNSSLEENGITNIESIEVSFHVFTMDGWDTIVDTDPITINF